MSNHKFLSLASKLASLGSDGGIFGPRLGRPGAEQMFGNRSKFEAGCERARLGQERGRSKVRVCVRVCLWT